MARANGTGSANCGHPIAHVNVQLDPRHAASKHTTSPINHTRLSPRKHSPDGATHARKQASSYRSLVGDKEKIRLGDWLGLLIDRKDIQPMINAIPLIHIFSLMEQLEEEDPD